MFGDYIGCLYRLGNFWELQSLASLYTPLMKKSTLLVILQELPLLHLMKDLYLAIILDNIGNNNKFLKIFAFVFS